MSTKDKATVQTQARYNRIAPIYDLMETLIERLGYGRWREELWSQVDGEQILEVGVGTGKNMLYYPLGIRVTAVDLSEGMLRRAHQRVSRACTQVDLSLVDAQRMALADGAFDAAVATFVFCSVPDPVQGLRELRRVVKSGGRVLLVEHVRVNRPVIGTLMDLLDPLVVRLMGPHINRQTVENVQKAGLEIEQVDDLAPGGLFKLIQART